MTRKLLQLYSLKWNPFAPDVPVDALFATPRIDSFTWRVEHLAREGGFAAILGEPGTGKSVTLRVLAARLVLSFTLFRKRFLRLFPDDLIGGSQIRPAVR